jgi:Ca-activated chloride channel family protein
MLTGYKKDREGKVVTTQVNEDVLENIALETGGRYYRSSSGEVELEAIAQALNALSHGEIGSELRTRYEERFQIPLFLAWLALVAETVLGDRRRRSKLLDAVKRRVA